MCLKETEKKPRQKLSVPVIDDAVRKGVDSPPVPAPASIFTK